MPKLRVESSVKWRIELELGHLGQARRLAAAQLLRHLGRRQALVARDRRRAAAGLRLLVDQLHARHLGEHVGEPVDLGRRPLLGDGDEQHVVHALVVAAERVARMDAPLARRRDHLAGVPSDADGKLLERCPICKHRLEPRALPQLLLRVGRERETGLPQLAQPLRPEPREVDEPAERQERLVRRDVRRRLLAADVLLAGLQGEDIAALARGVYRLADDPAGHPADEVLREPRGSRSAGRRTRGSCRPPGLRRARSRSRSVPAPRARRATAGRRARSRAPPRRSRRRRGPAPARGSRRRSAAGR